MELSGCGSNCNVCWTQQGVLHPEMTSCVELPLVVAASCWGCRHNVGQPRVSGLPPGGCQAIMYQWNMEAAGTNGVPGTSGFPQVGETALVWWHSTGQVAMFLHNVFVPGYWLLILEFGKWPVPGWRVQWLTGHHTVQVRAGSCDMRVACWPVTQGGLMGFRPWGIVWALRASLLLEHQPLMV